MSRRLDEHDLSDDHTKKKQMDGDMGGKESSKSKGKKDQLARAESVHLSGGKRITEGWRATVNFISTSIDTVIIRLSRGPLEE